MVHVQCASQCLYAYEANVKISHNHYKICGDLGKDAFCQMSHRSLFLDERSFLDPRGPLVEPSICSSRPARNNFPSPLFPPPPFPSSPPSVSSPLVMPVTLVCVVVVPPEGPASSHLCQDPDSISRAFLEQIVLVSSVGVGLLILTVVFPQRCSSASFYD